MFARIKFRRKRLIIIYLVLFSIIIAFKSHDFEDTECDNQLISNEIKLKTFVAKESRLSLTDPKWSALIDHRISVYSGFLFKDSSVRISSLVDQVLWAERKVRIECQFMRFANSSVKYKSMATLRVFAENYFGSKQYAASEIKCPLPRQYHSIIKYIAVGLGADRQLLPLTRAPSYYSNDTSLDTVVCIRPVFQSRDLLSSVVEFLAYYRANKISKFVFYDLDIDLTLKAFLTNLDYVDIAPWKLTINEYAVHAFGQRAAMQDCLMRYSSSPIIFVDLDEFIVIQEKRTTIQSLIAKKMADKSLSSLVINNRFLCHEFQSSHAFPMILSHSRIQTFYWRSGDRSKIIVLRPDTVIDARIHKVTATREGYHRQDLADSQVLLYHYRSCCGLNQEFVHLDHLNLYFKAIDDKYVEDFLIKWFETEINDFIDEFVVDYQPISERHSVVSTKS